MILQKLKEWKEKRKKTFFGLCAAGILAISSIIILGTATDNNKENNNIPSSQSESNTDAQDTNSYNVSQNKKQAILSISEGTKEASLLSTEGYPKINNLMTRYLNAKLKSSEETFQGLVSDPSMIDYERLHRKVEYIVSYQNVKSYVAQGINEIDYVVYLTYDIELPEIQTLAPSIDEIYVIMDENNSPKVYLGEISKESQKYFDELRDSNEVKELITGISEKFDEAIQTDDDLRDFYQSFSQVENKVKEDK